LALVNSLLFKERNLNSLPFKGRVGEGMVDTSAL
jgi:hypothetical protein